MAAINFLTQTITVEPKSSYNAFGDQVFGAGVTVKCKFVDKKSFIKDGNGEEIASDSHFYCLRLEDIENEYRVTYNSVKYEVIVVTEQVGTVTDLGHKRVDLKLIKV